MGMVGTTPARGRVLLVGDAAGLVNPMQGEGIAQAMTSGRAAAAAILATPGHAADSYRSRLAVEHLPYHRIAAAVHAGLVVTAPGNCSGRPASDGGGSWRRAVRWLGGVLERAARRRTPEPALCGRATVTQIGRVVTAPGATAKWFNASLV